MNRYQCGNSRRKQNIFLSYFSCRIQHLLLWEEISVLLSDSLPRYRLSNQNSVFMVVHLPGIGAWTERLHGAMDITKDALDWRHRASRRRGVHHHGMVCHVFR